MVKEIARPLQSRVILLCLSLVVTLVTTASCERPHGASQQLGATASPIANASAAVSPIGPSNSPIHNIDFENFTYSAAPVYSKQEGPFTLSDGEYRGRVRDGGVEPERVYHVDTVYGDVTRDGVDDAVVVLTMSIRGTAIPYYVYVFTIERDQPNLLWAFETGDRGDGGLRRVYAENGTLVTELYGTNVEVGGDYYSGKTGAACCPSTYTRSHYQWMQNQFRRTGQLEVFSSDGDAAYLPLLERPLRSVGER